MKDITSKKHINVMKTGLTFLDIYKFDDIIGIKNDEISILKSRHTPCREKLSMDEIEELSLDLVCRGLSIHNIALFSEPFKQEFKMKLRNLINEYKVE